MVYHGKDATVAYPSMVVVPTNETQSTCFCDVLCSFENQSLWRHFICDDTGEWIHQGLLMGSTCVVHNSSYIMDRGPDMCLTGVVIYCTISQLTANRAVAKHSTSADNGEMLGSIISHLSVHVVLRRFSSPYKPVKIYYSRRGVLSHSNDPILPPAVTPSTSSCGGHHFHMTGLQTRQYRRSTTGRLRT